ncbi:recombination mediator RecR [bacterium]|nr:recombination mediator RecR [bacterium]
MPKILDDLIIDIAKLPGIGKKTAERLAIYMLDSDNEYLESFSSNINNLNKEISNCSVCHCFSDKSDTSDDEEDCIICSEESRDKNVICILQKASDVIIFERTGYNGLYHILGNLISPIDGISEEDLNIESLLNRLNSISEIILATDASLEGDATALYLSNLLKNYSIKVTRLARGLPIGGTLEHVDQTTLSRSIEDRVELK